MVSTTDELVSTNPTVEALAWALGDEHASNNVWEDEGELIVNVTGYLSLLDDSDLLTVDKMGAAATVLNGQVASVGGVPVIVSEHVREDVNASGVQDGVTTDRTFALTVNRGEFAIGQRMALAVETDDSIYRESYQRVMVGFMREDFQNIGDDAGNDDVAILHNVDLDAD